CVRVVLEEALVDLLRPRGGRVDRDVPRGERVARAAVVHAHPQVAPSLRRGGGGAGVRHGGAEEAGDGDDRADRGGALEQLAPRPAGGGALVRRNGTHSRGPFSAPSPAPDGPSSRNPGSIEVTLRQSRRGGQAACAA